MLTPEQQARFFSLAPVCHRCPNLAGVCRVDGSPVADHAPAAYCPEDRYGEAGLPRPAGWVDRRLPTTAPGVPGAEHWGRDLWAKIHKRALAYKGDARAELDFLHQEVPAAFGCTGCGPEWAALLHDFPPDLRSADRLFAWTVEAHNRVNARLNKPLVPLAAARKLWVSLV